MTPTISEIKAAVHEVIDEQRRNFWVEPEQHYLDHQMLTDCRIERDEWRKNHEFISEIRGATGKAKSASIGFLVVACGGFLLWLLKMAWHSILNGVR